MRTFWKKALPLLLCLVTLLCLAPMAMAAEEAPEMKSSENFINVLKEMEGFSAKPYWDVNHYSIGYGTTCPSDKVSYYNKNPLTEKEAEEWLRSSLVGYEEDVIKYIKKHDLKLKQNQFDALVSFTYNCGGSWTGELNGYFNTAVRSGDTGNDFLYGICLYSSSAGNYVLINRRLCEANMYINGEYKAYNKGDAYPDNYKWVFLNGGGAMPRYPIYAYDAKKAEAIEIRFSDIPTGKTADGETFVYTFAGWYTEAGKKVSKADSSLTNGQVLYARWKDPDGKVVTLPTGTPVAKQKVTVTASTANMRKGPGTYYAKTGTQKKGTVLTLTETYTVGSTTWGNTNKGWVSLTSNTDYKEKPTVTFPQKGTVNANDVNYRTNPNGTKKGQYDKGTKVTITEVNDAGTWGKMSNGYWIFLDYVTYDKDKVTKVELLKKPTVLEYESYKNPLNLEGSVVLITYADGRQVAQTIARGDVKDNRTATSETAKVTATYGGKSVSFTISFKDQGPAKIVTQPKDTAVKMDSKVTVSVKATGGGLKYQWYYKNAGSNTWKTSGAKGANYTITMTDKISGRTVYCVVTSKDGTKVKSETAVIRAKLTITKQPTTVSAKLNSKVTASVKATGMGLKYQWYYKNAGSDTWKMSGAKGTNYTIAMTQAIVGRNIYCEITDQYGDVVKTDVVALTIQTAAANKAKITKQPTDASAVMGGKVSTTVKATGKGLTYQWYYANEGVTTYTKSGAKTATYSFAMKEHLSGRKVYCVVSDQYGNSVKTKTVTLYSKAAITRQPANDTAAMGEKMDFTVEATGKGLKYQWYYKNPGSTSFKKYAAGTAATYSTKMSTGADGRQVYCVITDKYGNSVKTKTVSLYSKVAITRQPADDTAAMGKKMDFTVEATGKDLKYQWYYKNPGSTSFKKYAAGTAATYSTKMSTGADGRQVYCVITDKYGNSVKTKTVSLYSEVAITQQPADVVVKMGSGAIAAVKATGKELSYQWYVAAPGSDTFEKTNVTTDTYNVTMEETVSGCKVYCVVTDKYGNTATSETVTLTGTDVVTTLRQQLEKRNGFIEITYQQDTLQGDTVLDQLARDIFYQAVEHTAVPTQGDYIFRHIKQLDYTANCVETENGYSVTLTYTVGYRATAEKEQQVDAKVKEILDELDVYNATDFEKTKAVYDYLCDNVISPVIPGSQDYTTYGALVNRSAVCHGLASAFYRLMLELDVDVRFISGKVGGSAHGWNIVAIDGVYYNVDVTKDAGFAPEEYRFFLKADSSFEGYEWDATYRTDAFMQAYPMADTDYQ